VGHSYDLQPTDAGIRFTAARADRLIGRGSGLTAIPKRRLRRK